MTPPEGGHPRPELPAFVFGRGPERLVWGLVDPTREHSTIPLAVGLEIGVISAEEAASGEPILVEVDVLILIGEQHVRWPVPVAFSPTATEARWGLLGFLDHFDVLLRGPLAIFTIEQTDDLPPPRHP